MSNLFTYVGGRAGDYRAPCGGWLSEQKFFLGGTYQHRVPSHRAVDTYENTTQVLNYDSGGPATISPYQRPDLIEVGGCNGVDQPACGPWPEEEIVANTFELSDGPITEDLSTCRKLGFKYCVAVKTRHGRAAFLDPDGCCDTLKPAYDTTPSTRRYRTITWEGELGDAYSVTGVPGDHHFDVTPDSPTGSRFFSSGSCTIKRNSGKTTFTDVINYATGFNPGRGVLVTGATNASPIVITTDIPHTLSTGDTIILAGVLGNLAANGTWTITVIDDTTFSLDGSSGSGAWTSGGQVLDHLGNAITPGGPYEDGNTEQHPVLRDVLGVNVCTKRIRISNATNATPIVIELGSTGEAELSLVTGDSITISGVLGNTAANGTWTVTVIDDGHVSLDGSAGSGAYTSGGILDPLPCWTPATTPITPTDAEDIVHGRYRRGLYSGPPNTLVVRSATSTTIEITVDPAAMGVDIEDLASPFRYYYLHVLITLSDPYDDSDVHDDVDDLLALWNFADDKVYPFRTDQRCTAGPLLSYHEYSSPQMPVVDLDATADTSAYTGAMLGGPNTVLGPYFDFRHIQYVDNSGSSGHANDFQPQYYGQWSDDPGPDFPGTPYATQWTTLVDELNLLPRRFQAYSSLPNQVYPGDTTYRPGQLIKSKYATVAIRRFSLNFARPCGPKDAITYDQVDVGDGGSFDCSGPTADLRFPGIDDPCEIGQWFDNKPKGQFILAEWTYNYRENYTDSGDPNYRPVTGPLKTLTLEQECLGFTPCCPPVVYFSDNDEDSPNCLVKITTARIDLDDCFGALNQQADLQWITDPFWQVPHRPCDLDVSVAWREDDGSGRADGPCPEDDLADCAWYPQRPWIEALLAVPVGAPSFPAGVILHYITVAEQNAGAVEGTDGILVNPPTQDSCWYAWWVYQINQEATIASSGRFSCLYADQLALCDDDPATKGA